MVKDNMTTKLMDADFDEESLSDANSDDLEGETTGLQKFRIIKGNTGTMSGCSQVIVFLMFWMITMGVCVLVTHIVAHDDPHRQTILLVGLAGSWIILANIFAVAVFVIDKCHAFNKQPRLSEALVHTQFALGGVVGGWLALCLTCYRPPGVKSERMSGFICRGMIFSAVGIGFVVLVVLRVIVPNLGLIYPH